MYDREWVHIGLSWFPVTCVLEIQVEHNFSWMTLTFSLKHKVKFSTESGQKWGHKECTNYSDSSVGFHMCLQITTNVNFSKL